METSEADNIYRELEKLGANVVEIKQQNPSVEALRALLAGMVKLDSERGGV